MYIEGKKTKDRLVLVPDVPQNERKKELELVHLKGSSTKKFSIA